LIATPIGNLQDISLRALDLLARADSLVCEDTRVTRKLLAAHGIDRGIDRPLSSYHEHNAERMRPELIQRMKYGEAVALVSDAGTPLISDPGYKLVRAAADAGLAVSVLPGPSAVVAALVISGLPSDRFFFAGFLPPKQTARRAALAELMQIPATLVFFESARRLPAALADMAGVLGARPAAVIRELTKIHEEARRGDLAALAAHYGAEGPPKGEVVVVIGPPEESQGKVSAEDLDASLRDALRGASLRDAVAAVTAESGLPRRRVYARALRLAAEGAAEGTSGADDES
jgi:16S rRNA (cytidine1402-2'-O)-methyltransferase